ncbi:TIGR02450 family Trp-rich protein [Neptuniibacter pectenicola]|jgi:tryptophan-rich hypothetical protein|uniref:TIGR02450 family Trp-rich protein n=1 Tax=Neptuniibacter pectenicola TaxID=1806669 RepID=A0ABU9TSN4_9GAMM|nr:MAG: hypothetical protein AXW15_11515 [Neptuniibacter sp. Phe_28]
MNPFNPNKLLLSKWTAVEPIEKKKHFIITELIRDEEDVHVVECVLEAVINQQRFTMDFNVLKNDECWLQGWR